MAPGWLWEDPEIALGATGGPWEGRGRGRGGHEQSELTFSNVWRPPAALSLRFPICLGSRTLSHYACAAKPPGREFSMRHYLRVFMALGPWAGNLRGGVQGPFFADAVYLLLDT